MGSQGCAHLGRRRTGVAGFRRGVAGGGALEAADDVLRLQRGSGARRSTRWGWRDFVTTT
jgi:hypothetical protein